MARYKLNLETKINIKTIKKIQKSQDNMNPSQETKWRVWFP
jgi:hypothetical protein